ncbi:hypothetical protein ACFE04_013069 [Oxalis oulophora]
MPKTITGWGTHNSSFIASVTYSAHNPMELHRRSRFQVSLLTKQQSTYNHAYLLFDKSPKRVNVSTIDIQFTTCANNTEMGLTKTVAFIDNNTTRNVICEESSITGLPGKHQMIRALNSFGPEGDIELGRAYHALIVKKGLCFDEFVRTSLVDMYAKCGDMESAVRLFSVMDCLDVALCNCLISGYVRNGMFDKAFRFFVQIQSNGVVPNHYTYSAMLSACGKLSAIKEGMQIHVCVVKTEFLSDPAVGNALLKMYMKYGMMKEAELLFTSLEEKNIISWTTIINGFYRRGDFLKALILFCSMGETGFDHNEYTYTTAIACCGSLKDLNTGRMLHAQAIKKKLALNNFVGSALLKLYSDLGKMDEAKLQIKNMEPSTVSWNSLISGFVNNEKTEEAVKIFCDMIENEGKCDEFTYSVILKACSSLPSLANCQQIHSHALKTKFDINTHVGSSLIEAYSKCGCLEDAEKVFDQLLAADVVAWNSMIKAYSQNSYPGKAISLFINMIKEGHRPTSSTFVAILSACSHSGLIEEGKKFFNSMVKTHGIAPEEIHYSCMIDLLGRANKLEEALDFIDNLPIEPTAPLWRPLLAACKYNGNLKLAEHVAKKILDLDPNDAAVYVTLSNMYAEKGRHADVEKERKLMTLKNIIKEPGCSWIEANHKIHRFFSHDKTHQITPEIYDELHKVVKQIQDSRPGATTILEENALYHSEKLAVCFGLLSLRTGKPIRVFKNLRVCTDCHLFMKKLSLVANREILLRDNYRFHHFKQGCCSCKDYW